MSDNPNVDLELEKRLIAAPLCTKEDAHGAERWELITSICFTPVMFFDRNLMFIYMSFDRLIELGRPITPMSLMAIMGETDWRDLLKNSQRLRAMKDLGFHSDKRRQKMLTEPWKVFKDLEGDSVLDAIGGPMFLVESSMLNISSDKDIREGANRILRLWQQRTQVSILYDAQMLASKPDSNREEIAVKTITAVQELENTFKPTKFAGTMVDDYIQNDDPSRPTCGEWPIRAMNQMMALKAGRLYTIGALQSRGKTSVGTAVLAQSLHMEGMGKGSAMFFSLEMPTEEILFLMMAQYIKAQTQDIENKNLNPSQLAQIQFLADTWREKEQLIIDDKRHTRESLLTAIRLHAVKHELKVIVIDHLQKVKKSDARIDTVEHIGNITGDLKEIAKELNIAVIQLSQLNRTTNKSGHKKDRTAESDLEPRISDLKGSGAIESDSDGIILVWWDGGAAIDGQISTQWIIAKNRQGPLKNIPITFHAASGQHFSYNNKGDDLYEL